MIWLSYILSLFTFISKGPWTYGNAGYNGPYYHKCLQFSGVSTYFYWQFENSVTHSFKIKFRAPPVRGFSYIELWMVGMQIPIVAALIEYSILLGLKKYFSKKEINPKISNFINDQLSKIDIGSKDLFCKRRENIDVSKITLNVYKNIDISAFVISLVYFIIFCLFYWL